MKISSVEATCLEVPFKFPFTEAPSTAGMLVVQVKTDDGLIGTGISRDQERFAVRELINREIRRYLLGKPPLDIEKIWSDAAWEIGTAYMARGGTIGRAVGAVDQALWDIKGQVLQQPIYRLLGGASPGSVGAYTTFGFNVFSKSELVGVATQVVKDGHGPLKYQVVAADRGQDLSVDVERIEAVREAIGDQVQLIVGCNGKFDLRRAKEFLKQIEPFAIACVDHPVYIRDVRLMTELRRHTSIPLAARSVSENQWGNRDLIVSGAVDIIHANVLDGGGYTECVKVAHMAEMFHLPVSTGGGWYLQNAHLIGGIRNGWLTEYHLVRERIYEVIYEKPPVAKNGRLPFTDEPGMGLRMKADAITEYAAS